MGGGGKTDRERERQREKRERKNMQQHNTNLPLKMSLQFQILKLFGGKLLLRQKEKERKEGRSTVNDREMKSLQTTRNKDER